MQIQLSWIDPVTGERREPVLETPVALGGEFTSMPQELDGNRVARIVLANEQVTEYHALIDVANGELIVVDQNSSTGTLINGVRLPSSTLIDGDRLQIGSYEIQLNPSSSQATSSSGMGASGECDRMVGFLFKRRCGRTTNIGCPYCSYPDNNPYYYDYSYYSGYGNYNRGYWGSNYYDNRDRYYYDPETGNVDFTEADNMSLEGEMDADFEMDMGAS